MILKNFFYLKKYGVLQVLIQVEEIICADVHKKLKLKHKSLLTIIIPRHIHRVLQIT